VADVRKAYRDRPWYIYINYALQAVCNRAINIIPTQYIICRFPTVCIPGKGVSDVKVNAGALKLLYDDSEDEFETIYDLRKV
jgi:hypothetical protein